MWSFWWSFFNFISQKIFLNSFLSTKNRKAADMETLTLSHKQGAHLEAAELHGF